MKVMKYCNPSISRFCGACDVVDVVISVQPPPWAGGTFKNMQRMQPNSWGGVVTMQIEDFRVRHNNG